MSSPKVIVAEFQHETNVFSPLKAGLPEFKEFYFSDADRVIADFGGTETIMGGFLQALDETGIEAVPVMATQANPSGLVTGDMFDFAVKRLLETIAANPDADGILLGLHGAMVSERALDAEGALLEAVRQAVGPDMPIVGTLDLHGNVTPLMVEKADAFFPYENYPHTDCLARGLDAGRCIAAMIQGEIKPVMKLINLPLLAHFIQTSAPIHQELHGLVMDHKIRLGVINVAYMHGFPWSDIPLAGMSVLAVTNNDPGLAESIVNDLADAIWQRRTSFQKELFSPKGAVEAAMAFPSGPVVIADVADNPGGGGSGDSTFILKALLEAEARDVVLAVIPDPAAVEKAVSAGVDQTVTVSLGGKLAPPEISGGPVTVTGRVRTIIDGHFYNKGPMMKGLLNKIGRTVVLDCGGIDIIVPEYRMQPFDAEILHRLGLDPTEQKILVLKSAVHYRASFEAMAAEIIEVDTPEYGTMNFPSLTFKHLNRPVWPLDDLSSRFRP